MSEAGRITVMSVDDHPLMRDGIASMIGRTPDMIMVAEATTGAEAVEQFREHRPDITLMDLQMPGISGMDAIRVIRDIEPNARIIVLTTYGGDVQTLQALDAGAAAFLLKDGLRQQLLDTIRAVHAGDRQAALNIRSTMLRGVSAALPAASSAKHVQSVEKAIAWLGKHYDQALSGEELAAHVNMSSSSLYQHFKILTGTTPLQYQKQLRLDNARRFIVSDGLDIATTAYRVGYSSVSQFTREYRSVFGESPARDRELSREAKAKQAATLAQIQRQ